MLRSRPAQNAAIAAGVAIAVLIGFYWGKFDAEITGFFRIGSVLPFSPYLDLARSKIYSGELGYDGQQFLTLAFDPGLHDPGSIAALDSPLYRYRRILYPLLGYLLGLGQPALIPYALVALNAIALVALVWVVSRYLNSTPPHAPCSTPHAPPSWGLFVLALPGVWIALALSTADLLSALWVAIALYAYRQQRPGATAIALALAGLTRETTLVVGLALLLASWRDFPSGTLRERRWRQVPLLLAALVPVALWNGYVIARFAQQGTYGAASNFGWPLLGLVQKVGAIASDLGPKAVLEAWAILTLLAAWGVVVLAAWRWPAQRDAVAIATLLYGLPLAASSLIILGYYLDYLRVYLDVFVLLLLSAAPPRLKGPPLAAAGLVSLAFLVAHS